MHGPLNVKDRNIYCRTKQSVWRLSEVTVMGD